MPVHNIMSFISRVLWSLLIPAIWLHHHLLRGLVSVRLQILLVGTCRLCGSWPVAGHNQRKVIGKDPICADLQLTWLGLSVPIKTVLSFLTQPVVHFHLPSQPTLMRSATSDPMHLKWRPSDTLEILRRLRQWLLLLPLLIVQLQDKTTNVYYNCGSQEAGLVKHSTAVI